MACINPGCPNSTHRQESTVTDENSVFIHEKISTIVDQPVHWCLDTLHRHRIRYTDRPYGGKLSKDIDRISSLFY